LELTILEFSGLAVFIFVAGAIDAMAGGGGLIALPAYAAFGVPPALLLGTNKLSSTLGVWVSTARYVRHIGAHPKEFLPMVAATLIASAAGAKAVLLLDPSWIRYMLLAALPFVALTVLGKHDFGREDTSGEHEPAALRARELAVAAPIGAYDGFFGPGTGTFLAIGFSRFCGYNLLHATTRAKVINMTSNAAALATFLIAGSASLEIGIPMGIVNIAGHWTGSHLAIKRGHAAIRPALVLICSVLFLKVAYDVFGG
jgi:uncharacterized membrane protein YfcA